MVFVIYSVFVIMLLFSLKKKSYIVFKTLNSLAFIGVAVYCAMTTQHVHLLLGILPGLIGCLAGDFMLATQYKKSFIYGLVCFFIANFCYVIYFMNFYPLSIIEFILPVVSIVIVIAFSYLQNMNYETYEKAILAYSFMITLAMVRSVVVYFALSTPMFLLAMIGFILYFISDIILLFGKFYDCRFKDKLTILNLIMYYYGMFFIAYSLLF